MSLEIKEKRYTLTGKLNNSASPIVRNFVIKAFDKDLITENDFLGSALTGEDGKFEIGFNKEQFANFFDQKPDIYFEVSYANQLLLSTEKNPICNALPGGELVELTIDYAGHLHFPKSMEDEPIETVPTQETGEIMLGAAAGQESDYLDSNLSDPKYGYDMVVGTTGAAINSTLKHYLFTAGSKIKPAAIWYQQQTPGGPITPMTPIAGVDPFSIADGGTPPDTLLNSDFVFAIKAGFGLPPGVDLDKLPNVVQFDKGNRMVTYQLYFKTFDIVTLDWGRHGAYAWKKIGQPSGKPYIFEFNVDINFDSADGTAFSQLPKSAQQQLLNMDTRSAFSVQQLYLDLNNAGMQSYPTIKGVAKNSPIKNLIQRDFVNTYWQTMHTNGKFVLGYAVKKNNVHPTTGSVQPTSLNLEVVPHYDENGNKTTDYNLYTLNYLMMTNNQKMPVSVPFDWNWVKKQDLLNNNKYHGSMAIRKKVFADYLGASLNKNLKGVISGNSSIKLKTILKHSVSCSLSSHLTNFSYQDKISSVFRYIFKMLGWTDDQLNSVILTMSSNHDSKSSDSTAITSGHFNLSASNLGFVSVKDNEITLNLYNSMNIDLDPADLGMGKVTGLISAYMTTAIYTVKVDPAGKLTVTMKDKYPKQVPTASSLDKDLFSGIDGTTNVATSLENSYKNIATQLTNYTKHLEKALNSAANRWVFPGANSFVFKQAAFSKNQDLVTHITYADPS